MKNIKKATALLIAVFMVLCLSACHPKGEVAVSSGDIKITSAMYSYYLVMADMEAQNYVEENFDTSVEGFDYYKQEIEGKSYEDYVKDLALEHCVKAIAYQKLCAENELELSTDDIANAEYNAQYNWYYYGYNYGYQYGYGDFLPLNGVSYETYAEAMKVNYYGDTYFKHIYDEGGEKEISKEDIQKALDENYIAVYALTESYTDDATLKTAKEKLTKYVDRLNAGEEFKKIYDEHNKTEDTTSSEVSSTTSSAASSDTSSNASSSEVTSSTSSDTTSSETSSSAEDTTPKAKDELIQIIGSNETESGYQFAKYDEVKAMAEDEIKLIEDSDSKVVYLIVKKDINEDSYYKEHQLASDLLYLLKGDEFTETVEDYMAGIEYDVSSFAIGQFKVKNINYGG